MRRRANLTPVSMAHGLTGLTLAHPISKMDARLFFRKPPQVFLILLMLSVFTNSFGQKKGSRGQTKTAQPTSELDVLRKQYVDTTKQYKASLEKLLALYRASQNKAEERAAKSKQLFTAGLISKTQLDESEHAVALEHLKVQGVEQQMKTADTQIAQALLEVEGEKQMAKLGRLPKGGFIKNTSFIRYSGSGTWLLSEAGKIESFFQQTFKRPLPIAVFGQGAIHNQWHLDHRNAMDVSVNPNGGEGQALMDFMRRNGIPFSAFRAAIPGVPTVPHIHLGLPSHRY